jgi:hypothetical protein
MLVPVLKVLFLIKQKYQNHSKQTILYKIKLLIKDTGINQGKNTFYILNLFLAVNSIENLNSSPSGNPGL